MATAQQTYLRTELERRHGRLESAMQSPAADHSLSNLLNQVDAALARMDAGTYGLCETCHDTIEADRLLANPLEQFCLDHLTNEERRALESDLLLAARIQQTLLPAWDFAPHGWNVRYHYAPANVVSGDYCDVFESKTGLVFLLGDVSGKGIAASMLMSHLHATFRSLADAELPLDRMVAVANRIFAESTMAGQFATLVVGRATREGAVELVSAGHLPLLHLCGGETRSQGATGVPLGMFPSATFPVFSFSIQAGDSLLIYTDGLTEARNATGEEYGLKRVHALADGHRTKPPAELISNCLADLHTFTAGSKQSDDLTLLALQRAA
ncbi:MAG TPA: SpoIIE family protein phosphatase [Candidatus Acidoferrum sp.]|nr:SpoIIE family protein phosphatase [Candidatus Acidoferrum sp.]